MARTKKPDPVVAVLDVEFTGDGELDPLGETLRFRPTRLSGRGALGAVAEAMLIMDPPSNYLAAKLAARQEANAQAHAGLLDRRLAAIEHQRVALADHPAVPPEKCPI